MTAGPLKRRIRIERPELTPDGRGGQERVWIAVAERWSEWRFVRGQESPEPGGQSGSALFKVRLHSEALTKAISTGDRIVDVGSGEAFNIRAVDIWTDQQSVWLDATGGVAT